MKSSSDSLVQLISVVAELTEENAFSQMYAFFREINGLDSAEIVSAWQAVQMFKTSPQVSNAGQQVAIIENSIISRMVRIVSHEKGVCPYECCDSFRWFISALEGDGARLHKICEAVI